MLMHVVAHGGCTDAKRESALKVDYGRKISCHMGELNLFQPCAGLTLYQLSYIPTRPTFLNQRGPTRPVLKASFLRSKWMRSMMATIHLGMMEVRCRLIPPAEPSGINLQLQPSELEQQRLNSCPTT